VDHGHEHGGGHAEGDDVRQRVELSPELAGGASHAGDPSVEHVEDHAAEDRQRGQLEGVLGVGNAIAPLHGPGVDDGVEAADEVPQREQAGEHGEALLRPIAQADLLADATAQPPGTSPPLLHA
jgi:hypothetical protein